MEIIDFIKVNFDHLIDNECREIAIGRFIMGDILSDNNVIIRLERLDSNEGTKCDCIIFSFLENHHLFAISIVELKSPNFKFSHSKSQIENCIRFLKQNIFNNQECRTLLRTLSWDFFPIIVSKSFKNRVSNRAMLSPNNRIEFIERQSRIVIRANYNNHDLLTIILRNFREN